MKKNNWLKKLVATILVGGLAVSGVVGCSPSDAQKVMNDQNQKKLEQSAKVMETTPIPQFQKSLERENIINRLKTNNDPAMLQWVYPMSAGRVIGRFPVRGKVTSGSKRLSATELPQWVQLGGTSQIEVLEAPDEMGAYGSSGDYVFWFDPAGNYHQHRGDYFESPVPYQIDKGYGTISVEVDQSEESKRANYTNQIKNSLKK